MTVFFDRRAETGTVSSSNPAEVWNDWRGADERWLFASAHDDDVVIGAGLTLLAGLANGVASYAVSFSDGQMGYCSAEQRRDIVRIRREETDRSYEYLGLPKENLFRFTYDDSNIMQSMGRRFAESGERNELCGGTGLQNSLTWTLRKVRPTRIFLPNHRDLHPDHQAVHTDLIISIFHAQGEIWPELGEPITEIPKLYEYATYSDFASPPTMRIRVSEELARRRAESVAMYQSQRQIGLIVESLRKAGGGEYLLEMEFDLIQPGKYDALF
jgi:LmbE family N-acetylglucosaminyl deacetylase